MIKKKRPKVVTDLLPVVEIPKNHTMSLDNFFTFYQLQSSKQPTHKGKSLSFKSSNTVVRKNCSFFDFRPDEYVSIMPWKDNKVVYIASNYCYIESTKLVKRYNQQIKKKIDVNRLFVFAFIKKV